MRKLLIVFMSLLLVSNLNAKEENLYKMFKGYPKIRVFLKDVTNETGEPSITEAAFRKIFKESLEKRKEIRFESVASQGDSDVVITARIKQYTFKEKAAPRPFSSITLVADTVEPKSAAKIVIDYEVCKAPGAETILSCKSFTTEERQPIKDMKGEAGCLKAIERNINRFIHKAFYEPKEKMMH